MKKLSKLLVVFSTVIAIGYSGISVSAADEYVPADEVFDEQEVLELQEILANMPVEADSKSMTRAGTYPSRAGVILVTNDKIKDLIPTGHAAIVYDGSQVVESLANGVQMGRNNWHSTKNDCTAVGVLSTTVQQDKDVTTWCWRQIGKPYNYNFYDTETTSKFYCSQLVYKGYKTMTGVNLNTNAFANALGNPVHPIELAVNGKVQVVYVK